MIGFFDSGFGGLTILKEVEKALPDFSYIYLGDNARTPYGSLSQEKIYQHTLQGVEELFHQGANFVILACNTSSTMALKRLQQEYLPENHPGKKILGIIIPTAEEMTGAKNIGIFATQATVSSGAYQAEIFKFNPQAKVFQQACPLLVPIIEAGNFDQLDSVVQGYVQELFKKSSGLDTIILGCTHYGIIENVFRRYIPNEIKIVSQGEIIADKLKKYLKNHSEFMDKLRKNQKKIFLTTENSPHVQELAESFYGEKIDLRTVILN
ncbi:MAG: glutamate racemase [Candidatus Moranbacteria bacterium]|nr:glutamate racemase [Candidatus Moranbacteria bacterium]